jgi:hypothetical protein
LKKTGVTRLEKRKPDAVVVGQAQKLAINPLSGKEKIASKSWSRIELLASLSDAEAKLYVISKNEADAMLISLAKIRA